jgi:hypothetical protein
MQYNNAAGSGKSIISTFTGIRKQALAKGLKDNIVFLTIGKMLSDGMLPEIEHLEKAAYYTDTIK